MLYLEDGCTMAGAGSSLSVRWHEGDACLFVCVGVRSGSAVAGSSGTVGGGSRGDGDLLLVVDKAVERAEAVNEWSQQAIRVGWHDEWWRWELTPRCRWQTWLRIGCWTVASDIETKRTIQKERRAGSTR